MTTLRSARTFLGRCWGRFAGLSRPAQLFFWILALASVTRLALAAFVSTRPDPPAPSAILLALALGPLADLRAAAWLTLPLFLVAALAPARWRDRRAIVWTGRATLALAFFGTLFAAAAEVFFFEEFRSRFNFVAVDYLVYPTEVTRNIWESYPTGWILAGLSATVALAVVGLERSRRLAPSAPSRRRRAVAAGAVALFAVGSALFWPAVLARPSADREVAELAGNGAVSFWRALLGDGETYRGLYARMDEAAALSRVQEEIAPAAAATGRFVPGTTARAVASRPGPHARNVVVVLEESFGSEFVRSLTPDAPYPVDVAPELERVAAGGTLFTHAYSSGNRTIRAIEATTTSLPPLPGISLVRRSASKDLFTLPAVLAAHGYRTEFVYGGRALFDGMGAYLRANGVERVVDQGDFPDDAFRTAWGVADDAIFDRALVEADALAAEGAPFYQLVLTVSNHRPYTFPTERLAPDPRLGRRANAVRYADHALGSYVDRARERPWAADTLFVLMGDHGARVYGASEIPMASYRVPILFLAPGGQVAAGVRDDTLASSIDVPPTVLGCLGLGYESRFFGRDLFEPATTPRAFLGHNATIAMLEGDRMALLGLQGSRRFARYDRGSDALTIEPATTAGDRALLDDAVAFYETADELYRSGRYRMPTALPPPRVAPPLVADGITPSSASPARVRDRADRSRAAAADPRTGSRTD